MIRGTLQRLAKMESEELRFRLLCEVRKATGRLATTLSPPAWDRASLAALLNDGDRTRAWPALRTALRRRDYHQAHRLLAEHFTTRASAFPINSREVADVAALIRRAFPAAREAAMARADAVIGGRYDLLGYKDLELGTRPDWHADPVHGRSAPRTYWASVPYLDAAAGDHKVIWELNRHQHWLVFGRAFALSGDARYYEAFTRQLADWLAANPPLIGTNWASMLELGFRSIAWLWSLELFAAAASPADREPWAVDLLIALDRQLTHVEHNLSHYFSPNTHLSGEALALYVAGCALPELKASTRRVALGRAILVQEATRQVRADGGHAELSAHYHRYSTDFYLLAARVARRAGDGAADIFEEVATKQARYLRTICDDRGVRPQIGDDDGGQMFPMCGRASEDCRDTLANAAILSGDAALAIGATPEEAYWFCGVDAGRFTGETRRWPSAALSASGYYVSRTPRGDHLVFDAGPHGFLNGGHAHADALSCTLSVGGRPLLIDPGTATYTMDGELRDRFRSTMMHNSIVLSGQTQSQPVGAFEWRTRTSADAPLWRSNADCDYVEGTHLAYAPARHTRAILAVHGVGWWILDHVLGAPAPVTVENYWHLDPVWQPALQGAQVCRLTTGDGHALALASTSDLDLIAPGTHPLAFRSPVYGTLEPSPVLRAATTAARVKTVATFVPATAEIAEQLAIEEVPLVTEPGPQWHGCAFRVRWRRGAMVLLAAVESNGVAPRDTSAPAARWGTAARQTDARVAALVDHAGGRAEAILINGALVTSASGETIVSLSRRVPMLRVARASVAPTMHEVGGEVPGL